MVMMMMLMAMIHVPHSGIRGSRSVVFFTRVTKRVIPHEGQLKGSIEGGPCAPIWDTRVTKRVIPHALQRVFACPIRFCEHRSPWPSDVPSGAALTSATTSAGDACVETPWGNLLWPFACQAGIFDGGELLDILKSKLPLARAHSCSSAQRPTSLGDVVSFSIQYY